MFMEVHTNNKYGTQKLFNIYSTQETSLVV